MHRQVQVDGKARQDADEQLTNRSKVLRFTSDQTHTAWNMQIEQAV